jgi:hypothetical protein
MAENPDVVRMLGMWWLMHESFDEAFRAAAERGRSGAGGPDAFADGLAAAVQAETETLRAALAAGERPGDSVPAAKAIEDLRFEVGELRGRIESMQASLDAIARALEKPGAGS